jgi:hypothetical protein
MQLHADISYYVVLGGRMTVLEDMYAYLKVISQHPFGGTEETAKILIKKTCP